VIQVFYNKYKNKYNQGTLTEEEKVFPLLMFHKDDYDKTAIDYAREEHHYQTFKILIKFMLISKNEHLFSKMIIENLPYMV